MSILVSPLSQVMELVGQRRPDHVISLLDPDMPFPELGPAYDGRHLRLEFHDVNEPLPGMIPPGDDHVGHLLRFLGDSADGQSLLVHCRAGISRSTATAFIVACYRNPDIDELAIARELRRVAPLARPNETLIAIADRLMKRGGRMSAAYTETFAELEWVLVSENVPFELDSSFLS